MVSSRYFMGVMDIFDRYPGDICSMSWRYLMGVLMIILISVLEIFDGCPIDI